MYNRSERQLMLAQMRATASAFYASATRIGNHSFIEFTGLMNEYIKVCSDAHQNGVDFTECNAHGGHPLPMAAHQVDYVNEKLGCIFAGRSVMSALPKEEPSG
jgi:hypothetical protein